MPHKSSGKKERSPAVILRRSPRLRQIVLAEPEYPKTPNPEQHRRTRSRSLATPISLTGVSSQTRSHRSKSKQCSQKLDESCNTRQRQKSVHSERLNRCVDECNAEKLSRGSDRRNEKSQKPVTRSSCRRDLDKSSNGCSSGEMILKEGVSISKQSKSMSLKNKVKHSKKNHDSNPDQFDTLTYDDKRNKPVLSITENRVLDYEELSKKDEDKTKNQVAVTKKQKNIGVKRKRNQFENMTQGWTKDQELSLERAYLEAKPTPHFWKKVSRLVPGKSAQECFDKIHGSHLTPPQPRTRSRSRVSNPENPSLTASKLLNTSSPTTKKPRYRKQKSHVIQRNVRHMLQNQFKPEQDSNADMFSLLEPTFNPSVNLNLMLTTPDRNPEANDAHKRCSTVRKSVSRFSSFHQTTTLMSPPVLKQVKNKALHEKYIDLLNCREANRKAASKKAGKVDKSKVMKVEGSAERKEAIKAAKNALVFGAKDAINEFQNQQAAALNDLFDCETSDDNDNDNDDDDDNDQVF